MPPFGPQREPARVPAVRRERISEDRISRERFNRCRCPGDCAVPQSPGPVSVTASRRPAVRSAFHRRLLAQVGERGFRPENPFPARLLVGHVAKEDTAYSDREQHQPQKYGDRGCEHLDVEENAFHRAHLLLVPSAPTIPPPGERIPPTFHNAAFIFPAGRKRHAKRAFMTS